MVTALVEVALGGAVGMRIDHEVYGSTTLRVADVRHG